jgi:hypothetical protein
VSWSHSLTIACVAFAAFVFALSWLAGYRKGQRRNRFRSYGSVLPTPRRESIITRDSEWRVARPSGYFPFESTPFSGGQS